MQTDRPSRSSDDQVKWRSLPSPEGDVKYSVPNWSTFVLNTLKLKESVFLNKTVKAVPFRIYLKVVVPKN